ncbi:hypothetical protein [Priestia megaterium]|uniref:hypothetical protein n=1 Tax=Priestia megaterium TaxID=1404 RepID=UPI002E1C251B|nr:hypothetical protein [Priestia megaterium]MED4278299.1 hypothetical protein [Priestia megaterium]MED4314404.1 hypothetical protein [Priestia megaterium]
MEKIYGLTKQEFAEMFKEDGTLKGSAWQKVERKIKKECEFEKTGNGRGTRYNILGDAVKRVHGNTGRIDKSSWKYRLAEAIIELGTDSKFMSKSMLLTHVGLKTENMLHVEHKFDGMKYAELNTVEQLVFETQGNVELALHRLMIQALSLIGRDDMFENVSYDEELHVKTRGKFKLAGDLGGCYDVYLQARNEATERVTEKYGKYMNYKRRQALITAEYQNIIKENIQYQPFYDNGIEYFYKKYKITSKNSSSAKAEEFIKNYIEYTKEIVEKSAIKLHEKDIKGLFISAEEMVIESKNIVDLIFENLTEPVFVKTYDELISNAINKSNCISQDEIDSALNFMFGAE